MTTPAVNDYYNLTIPSTRTTRAPDGSQSTVSNGGSTIKQYADLRPASTSGFRANGWVYPNRWSHTFWEFRVESSSALRREYPAPGWDTSYNNVAWDARPVTPPWLRPDPYQNLVNKAETAALLKLKNQKVNLGVLVAERHETMRMFAEAANAAALAYRKFRRAHPKDWIKVLRHDANYDKKRWPKTWLQTQLGLKPFISDLQGAAEIANKSAMQRPPVVTVKGTAKDSVVLPGFAQGDWWHMVWRDTVDYNVFVRLDYVQDSPLEASLASLGISNPFEVAWELLPYSFVLDYLVGVGDYISTWDAAFGWNFLSGSRSEKVSLKRKGRAQPISSEIAGFCADTCSGRATWFDRYVYSTSPLPSGPVWKDPFSYSHTATLLSLVAVSLKP